MLTGPLDLRILQDRGSIDDHHLVEGEDRGAVIGPVIGCHPDGDGITLGEKGVRHGVLQGRVGLTDHLDPVHIPNISVHTLGIVILVIEIDDLCGEGGNPGRIVPYGVDPDRIHFRCGVVNGDLLGLHCRTVIGSVVRLHHAVDAVTLVDVGTVDGFP